MGGSHDWYERAELRLGLVPILPGPGPFGWFGFCFCFVFFILLLLSIDGDGKVVKKESGSLGLRGFLSFVILYS